jgi:hypothetical protein
MRHDLDRELFARVWEVLIVRWFGDQLVKYEADPDPLGAGRDDVSVDSPFRADLNRVSATSSEESR